jgi:hypothetical protein
MRVIECEGGWATIARDGDYVPVEALAKMQ